MSSPYPTPVIACMPTTVADALAQTLAEWELGAVYGVSGANIENFHDAIHRLDDPRLTSISARSENGAAFMADAHSRINGGLSVCCSTSGGGMMNLAVGVAEAYQEGVPLLAIVGQGPRALEGRGGFQDSSGLCSTVDATGMWRSISKEVRRVRSAETFWADLEAVVRAAINGRRGPGVLLIPRDVFDQPTPPRPESWPTTLREMIQIAAPRDSAVNRLADQLRGASRPVIIAGPMVRGSERSEAVAQLARELQIPVVTTLADVGAFPQTDPLNLGVIGTAGHPSAHRHLNEQADLLIAIGTRLEIMCRAPITPALERCTTIFVDDDPTLRHDTLPHGATVIGDVALTIKGLLREMQGEHRWSGRPDGYRLSRFAPRLAAPAAVELERTSEPSEGLRQSVALRILERALPSRGHILYDAGNCAASAMHYMHAPPGVSTTVALGMGGMGYAIAGAIGAQLGGDPGGRTAVICGDGAFMMLGMEVHTAVDLGLPILFVVVNNGGHGMCVTRQQLYFNGRIECSRYARPSIAGIARGLGDPADLWVGSADTPEGLECALKALDDWRWRGPAVLELNLGTEEVPPFTPFLRADAPVEEVPGVYAPEQGTHAVQAA